MGDGIIRARYRDSDKAEKMMTPGEVYGFHSSSTMLQRVQERASHPRGRLQQQFPRFDVNPNTGEPPNNHRRTITATNTVYHDAAHPSHIVLSLVPVKNSSGGEPTARTGTRTTRTGTTCSPEEK